MTDKKEKMIAELVEAFGNYYNLYMRDEADDAENCMNEQQHEDALACERALSNAAKMGYK